MKSPLFIDQILLENSKILNGEWKSSIHDFSPPLTTHIPAGITHTVPDSAYKSYQKGKDRACADVVICTRMPNNEKAVLLSQRADGTTYANLWWIYGGAIPAYTQISDFLQESTKRECGISVSPEVLIGVYRTCATESVDSSVNTCFGATVAYSDIVRQTHRDSAHKAIRLFTLEELHKIPESQKHWYPLRVARLALSAMP